MVVQELDSWLEDVMDIPTLQTPRLTLRAYRVEDREAFVALNVDPVARAHMDGPLTKARAQALFESLLSPTFHVWAVLETSGEYIGHVFLTPTLEDGDRELGFLFAPPHWGQGYATEAARCVLQHVRSRHPDWSMVATVDLDHGVSLRVLEKLGFVRTRTIEDEEPPWAVYTLTST